jgi:hypothetical protein
MGLLYLYLYLSTKKGFTRMRLCISFIHTLSVFLISARSVGDTQTPNIPYGTGLANRELFVEVYPTFCEGLLQIWAFVP